MPSLTPSLIADLAPRAPGPAGNLTHRLLIPQVLFNLAPLKSTCIPLARLYSLPLPHHTLVPPANWTLLGNTRPFPSHRSLLRHVHYVMYTRTSMLRGWSVSPLYPGDFCGPCAQAILAVVGIAHDARYLQIKQSNRCAIFGAPKTYPLPSECQILLQRRPSRHATIRRRRGRSLSCNCTYEILNYPHPSLPPLNFHPCIHQLRR